MAIIHNTVVLSLRDDLVHRQHIVNHFHQIGIEKYGFWPAVRHDDVPVLKLYRDGGVAAYPPCFRCQCSGAQCACVNNILIPQQVANWLSFVELWKSLPDDPNQFYLICEDDVAFHANSMKILRDFLNSFVQTLPNVLIRLANSGERPYTTLVPAIATTTDRVVMSNAAYIISGAMAALLCRTFTRVTTTSDIWLHHSIANSAEVQALTLDPLLATDLSYNKEYAQFVSRIHPKGIDSADSARKAAHTMRAETAEEYGDLVSKWSAPRE